MSNPLLKHVKIGFENVESITIPSEDIEYFSASRIFTNCSFWNFGSISSKHLDIKQTCDSFSMNVINHDKYPRLTQHVDIVDVTLYYEDGGELAFHVPWGDHEYNNTCQNNELKDDTLIIRITENKTNH